jgi:hypothetical protein
MPDGKPAIGPYAGRIFEVLSEVLIPDGGEIPVQVTETGSYGFFARYLRDQGEAAAFGQKALLVVFDLLPFLFIGRFKRFVNLSPQERDLYLMDWYSSRIYYRRMLVLLLKTITGMGFYGDPKVLEVLDYELPCEEGVKK